MRGKFPLGQFGSRKACYGVIFWWTILRKAIEVSFIQVRHLYIDFGSTNFGVPGRKFLYLIKKGLEECKFSYLIRNLIKRFSRNVCLITILTIFTRKQSTPSFPKNEHFLPPDTHTRRFHVTIFQCSFYVLNNILQEACHMW